MKPLNLYQKPYAISSILIISKNRRPRSSIQFSHFLEPATTHPEPFHGSPREETCGAKPTSTCSRRFSDRTVPYYWSSRSSY